MSAPSSPTRNSRQISTSTIISGTSTLSSDACSARERRLTPTAMPQPPTILVFDSGLGGLTVFGEVLKARHDARFVYLADDAGFPYGEIPEEALITRIMHVIGKGIANHKP